MGTRSLSAEEEQRRQDLKKAMKELDTGSGKISKQDFTSLFTALGDKLSDTEAQYFLSDAVIGDADHIEIEHIIDNVIFGTL